MVIPVEGQPDGLLEKEILPDGNFAVVRAEHGVFFRRLPDRERIGHADHLHVDGIIPPLVAYRRGIDLFAVVVIGDADFAAGDPFVVADERHARPVAFDLNCPGVAGLMTFSASAGETEKQNLPGTNLQSRVLIALSTLCEANTRWMPAERPMRAMSSHMAASFSDLPRTPFDSS